MPSLRTKAEAVLRTRLCIGLVWPCTFRISACFSTFSCKNICTNRILASPFDKPQAKIEQYNERGRFLNWFLFFLQINLAAPELVQCEATKQRQTEEEWKQEQSVVVVFHERPQKLSFKRKPCFV